MRQGLQRVGNLSRYVAVHLRKLLFGCAGAFLPELPLMLRLAGGGQPGLFLPMLKFKEPSPGSPSYEDTPQSPNCRLPPGHPPRRNFDAPGTLEYSIAPGMHTRAETVQHPLQFRVRVSHRIA